MYESTCEASPESSAGSQDLIPIIVEQELRKQRLEIDPKAVFDAQPLTYKYFGAKNDDDNGGGGGGGGATRTAPPLKVILPNQTHT